MNGAPEVPDAKLIDLCIRYAECRGDIMELTHKSNVLFAKIIGTSPETLAGMRALAAATLAGPPTGELESSLIEAVLQLVQP